MKTDATSIQRAAEAVRAADGMLIGTGAGMGVDSGLPDFRGDHGFWRAYPPFKKLGLSFVDMANPAWFQRDPRLAWGFYGHRMHLYRDTVPHAGFQILREWAAGMPEGAFVFTSNVDGQFQRAGYDDDVVMECHGSIHHLQCSRGCPSQIESADAVTVEVDLSTFRARPPLPQCSNCGSVARPNVLMFGDWGWDSARTADQQRRFDEWMGEMAGRCLVIVEIGAGTAVPTVRWMCEQSAQRLEAQLVRINPREAQGPPGSLGISMGGLAGLEAIAGAL